MPHNQETGGFVSSLDLGLIGNGTIGALIDKHANIVWACFPRFDGDPLFCALLNNNELQSDFGYFSVELIDSVHTEQCYRSNTAILVTRLFDCHGNSIEITDFAPRFNMHGRVFRPMMLIRRVKCLSGSPRIRIKLRPACNYGERHPSITWGSNHIRYVTPDMVVRLTTNASITALNQETPFFLDSTVTLLLGPDETVHDSIEQIGQRFLDDTSTYWQGWVRNLAIPFEWQDAVIRAAITLKLNTFDDTGAIIAAMTTSIPESENSGRNWDYRYCWLRDGYFVVNALNRLGATNTMESYLGYVVNIAAGSDGGNLQPVYGIDGCASLDEKEILTLSGYRGMNPVRIGNSAYNQVQHDVYGSAILAATHIFFDQRLTRCGDKALFHRLEALGEKAVLLYAQPDAGLWELRGETRVHTFSALMCWAACDRLARIAERLDLSEHAIRWATHGNHIRLDILDQAWNPGRKSFVSTFGGQELDASLLLLAEFSFIQADDPRFVDTVAAIERDLKRGDFVFRYVEKDDFGVPENAFLVCSFWYVNALASLGRSDEARILFEKLLSFRNQHGLFSEHINPVTGEQWGNFVQTYSMVGLISSAIRLSIPWNQAF